MAKNLQVNLAFTADTNAAMQNLQTLRNSLNEISSLPFSVGKNISSDLQTAANSASQLQKHLGAAMDVKTGNINLNKLQSSLQQSNQSLSQLTSGLLHAGMTGEKAFIATYSAIAQSNLQLKKSNTLLSQFALTMKNTAKWQLSSSLLHGLISGFNQAIDYAKDLNTSLNNIQIVTGQSSEQMAEFAKQANKAAKELRSTTVAYTDAALIYYQQGLDGKAVTDRANTTVKLANVTGESAETVSQWMTSVWNNFDDGSKSLEYYADVMTALGAATASSSDEIAEGLEKFAAVADTVGLSYESATAALATITATTRQSADVVGTALKTLFARIQDLDLGKTLEDGTTLGSYSEALSKVGINIKDANGQLKDMDIILDEMGTKWEQLDKDQQVALAKNVAGIRQYTQLIALMDNYDFYKQNQDIAAGAEGTLEEQSKIYEQSWEAASKNVKASLESMYNVLIPTDFIVDFTNGLADVVSGFTDILDAAGGLKTILLLISSVVLTKFQAQIASAMDTGLQKTQALITSTQKLVEAQGGIFKAVSTKIKSSFVNAAQNQTTQNKVLMDKEATGIQAQTQEGLAKALNQTDASGNKLPLSEGFVAQVKSLQQIEQYNTKILNLKDKMTQAEFEELQLKQQHLKILGEESAANAQKISDLQLQLEVLKDQQSTQFNIKQFQDNNGNFKVQSNTQYLNDEEQTGFEMATRAAVTAGGYKTQDAYATAQSDSQTIDFTSLEAAKVTQTEILDIVSKTKQAELEIADIIKHKSADQNEFKVSISQTVDELVRSGKLTKEQGAYLTKNLGNYKNMDSLAENLTKRMKGISSGAQGAARTLNVGKEALESSVKHGHELYAAGVKNKEIMGRTTQETKAMDEKLESIVKKGVSFGNMFVKGLQGASQMAMGLSMLQGAITSIGDAFKEGEFNLSSFLSGLTSLGMAVPMVVSGFQSLMTLMSGFTAVQHLSTKASYDKITALVTEKGAATSLAAEEKILAAAKASGATVEQITIVLSELKAGKTLKEALATANLTGATWAQVAANLGLQASMWPVLLITLAVVAAFAVLVGIIALVVKAFKDAEANSPEGKLKTLEEAANESQKALERVKNEVKAVNDSLEQLKDSYKALDAMQKGTVEWANATSEVNKQITDLLDKYSGLGQYVYRDADGVLRLLDEGYEYIEQKNQEQIAVMTNSNINDRIKIADQKIDNYINKWDKKVETANTRKETLDWMKKSPQDQLEDLFNNYILQDYGNIGKTKTPPKQLNALDVFGMNAGMAVTPADIISKGLDPKEYYKDLEEIAKLKKEIEQLSNTQIENKMSAAGSVRNADQAKEIFGKNITHEDLLKKGRDKITMGWNDSANYSKNDAAWKDIEQFMKLYGEGTEYVAQRDGDMILKIEGEEKAFSEDQVKDVLAEYYSTEAIEQEIANNMRNTLKEITPFGNVTAETLDGMKAIGIDPFEINKLSNDTLIALDNLQVKLNESFEEISKDIDSDKIFAEIIKGFGNSETALEEFAATFDGIDWSNVDNVRSLGLAAEQLEQGTITIEEFTYAIEKMNAATELSNMGAFFSEAAQNLGLNEEDAAIMQEYARCLMEAAGEADDLSSSLEVDAQAAADLAIEITRMNKGIDSLADGFENWSDILNNSSKTSYEYAEAMLGIKSSLADVLDIESDMLSNDFVKKHLSEIEKAAQGDEKAIDDLRAALDEDIIQNIILTSPDELGNQIKELDSKLRSDLEALNAEIPDLEVGMVLTGATEAEQQFIDTANRMVQEAGMTADEANAYFAGMGYEPIVEQTDIEDATTQEIPESRATTTIKSVGFSNESMTILGKEVDFIKAPQLVTETKVQDIGSKSSKGKARVFGFSGGAKKPTGAKIVGFKKKAGGSSSNYSSKNSGGSSPGSSTKSSKDSSSKTATKDKLDISKEGDFYHDINREIERLADSTERLSTAKDYAFGDKRVKAIEEETKAIEKEIKAQDKLIKRANIRIGQGQTNLKNKYGAEFDEKGEITNYDSMLKTEVEKYNAAVEEYNKMAAKKDSNQLTDEQWAAAEKKFEDAEERYNNFLEDIDGYEVDLDIRDDAIQDKLDKIREKFDKMLEGVSYEVEVTVEVNDFQIKALERELRYLNDDTTDGAAKVANMTKQMDRQMGNIDMYKGGIAKTLATAGATDDQIKAYMDGNSKAIQGLDLTPEQMKMLTDFTEGIMESEEAIDELRESIEGQTMATFEAWHEKIEKNNEAFEHGIAIVDTYKNMIDIVGKDRLGIDEAFMQDLEATKMSAAEGKVANAKTQVDTTKNALAKAREELANTDKSDTESIKKWEKDIEALESQLRLDEQAFTEAWAESLTTAAEIFSDQMSRAFDDMEDQLAGTFKSLADLRAQYDKDQQIADRYLDGGEKLYELSKLNRKIQQDMDKSTSIKAQKELMEMQEIIAAYQADGAKMSQYELEALQKKYDLKLAEIALEEAQNARSTVRLRRDSSGNMNYVYTADEDKTADAQQKYEDALEASRQLAEDQSKELTESILSNREQMMSELRELNIANFASEKEYLEAIDAIKSHYSEQEQYYVTQYQGVVARSQLTYAQDFAEYEGWSGKKLESSILLKEKLGDNEDEMGMNTWGFVEEYGNAMTEMCGDLGLPIVSAQDLQDALGTGTGEGTGLYDTMIASAAAWASGMGTNTENVGASFTLMLDGKDGKGGIKGVVAGVNETLTGFYETAKGDVTTFIGTKNDDNSFSGKMNQAGKTFNLVNAGAETLLTNLTKQDGAYNKITLSGESFISSFNGKIGKVSFSPLQTEATTIETTLGTYDNEKSPLGKINKNVDNWKQNIDKTMSSAGTTVDGFSDTVSESINGKDGVKENINKAKTNTTEYGKEAKKQFNETAEKVAAWQKKYSENLSKAKKSTDNLVDSLGDLKDQKVKVTVEGLKEPYKDCEKLRKSLEALKAEYKTTIKTSYETNYKSNYETSGDAPTDGQGNNGVVEVGDTVTFDSGRYYERSDGSGRSGARGIGKQTKVTYINQGAAYPIHVQSSSGAYGWLTKSQISGYDTGGYTGEWGTDGKLAFLHQKEIVLNSSDTENLLTAVSIIREIAKQLELNALSMGITNLVGSIGKIPRELQKDTLQQEVHITAEFPNATNHSEIEEAFRNLPNLASQYIHRR